MTDDRMYPELSPEGGKEAQALIDKFKTALAIAAKDAIGDLYCDIAVHIESDSWTNYRNSLMDGMCDYGNRKDYPHDFKKIRQKIFKDNRSDIIDDLNQDLVDEVASLKSQLEYRRY